MIQDRPRPRPGILDIAPYVPGDDRSSAPRVFKLSSNETPVGPSPAAIEAYRAGSESLHVYPDGAARILREAIGAAYGLNPDRIVCGAGSDEILNLIAHAYIGPGDEAIHSEHGFLVYPIAIRAAGGTPVIAPETVLTADVDAVLARVTERTRVVFLANPNNPTGTYLPRGELERLHAGLPADVLLVLDQAYADYLEPGTDDGGLALAAAHANVLVTRTFSKIYGLAGERIGWATGAPHLIDALNRIRGPFNVTLSGQRAAVAALADQAFVDASRAHNRAERTRFTEAIGALGNHGLRVIPSETNFVLVLFEGPLSAERALHGLSERGYAVRHLPGQGLPQALRVTVGTREQMDAVAAALREMTEAAR
jgi:histidinol-phosphate aminotransferase